MKKQKMLKLTAFPTNPAIENAFSAPVTHSGEISVVFKGRDISIYGWDGSSWSTIYTWNSSDPQFKFSNTYQSYYLKSLNGSEETVNVSFFSTQSYQGSTPLLVGVDRGTKLYDIDEVPIYTADDHNKMLTIMSNGSLAWLLANESFIVPSEGGEPSGVVGLEEDSGLTLHGNAQLVDGVLSLDGTAGTYASLPHSSDFDRESGDLTINMWIKANSLPDNWNAGLVSKMGTGWDGYITAISTMQADAGGNMTSGGLQTTSWVGGSNPTANNRAEPSGGISLGVWHHVAYVMPSTGDYKMYFNGQAVHSYAPTARNTSTTGDLRIGGWQNGSYSGFFDGFIDGVSIEKTALSASDISTLHSVGREESQDDSSNPNVASPSLIADVLNHPSTTIVGNPVYQDNILTLDGSSYMIHGDIAEFMYQDYMTTNLWFRNDGGSRKSKLWSFGAAHTSNNKFAHVLQQENDSDLRFVSAAGSVTNPNHYSIYDDAWHMITAVWDNVNGVKRLYLDGVQLGSDINFSAKVNPFRDGDDVYGLIIGTGTGLGVVRSHEAYKGQFTKMEVENSVWDSSQITSKFNEGSGIPTIQSSPGAFLEDLSSVIARDASKFTNGIYRDTQTGSTGGMKVELKDDGILEYDPVTNETVNDEFTISWWMHLDSTQVAGNLGLIGSNVASVNGEVRRFTFNLGGGAALTDPDLYSYTRGPRTTQNPETGVSMAGVWTHAAIVIRNDSSNTVASLYLNGSKLDNSISYPLGTKLFPPSTHQTFVFGAGSQSYSVKGLFDSMQIADGVALTDEQVAAIAGQSDRQMSIETAAPAASYLETAATLFGGANLSNDSLVLDGIDDYAVIDDGFRFTDKMTTSVWFKTTATGDRRIYSSHVRSMSGEDYRNGFFARLNNGQLKFRHPAGGTGELTGPSGLNDGTWHHLALSWEASVGYTLYVDGSQVGSGASGVSDGYASDWGLYIGANPWNRTPQEPYAFFDGEIKKFEVLNEVLTSQQVTDLYNAGA
jgi:hypothetical protein